MNEKRNELIRRPQGISPDQIIDPRENKEQVELDKHQTAQRERAKQLRIGDYLYVEVVTIRGGARPSIDKVLGEIVELENDGEATARPKVKLIEGLNPGKETWFLETDEWWLAKPLIDIETGNADAHALVKRD